MHLKCRYQAPYLQCGVVDRSIDESFIVSDKMIDKIINSLSFDYLMIAYNQSKNQNIKNKAFVKINEMLDEIEKDNLLRQELYEKINDLSTTPH